MINELSYNKGFIIINKDFGDFPFERLLQLDDEDFTKPNQYQSIWENLILNIFAKAITDFPVACDNNNQYFEELNNYAKACLGDIVEMHKEVVTRTTKTSVGLHSDFLDGSHEIGKSLSIGSGENNISMINATLETLIINYFLTCSEYRKIIIQFDRLDDNYNQYQSLEQYYQAIISLFKVVYHLNQGFRSKKITNAKIVLYLRSDIYKELGKRDAESARWDDFEVTINWTIVNRSDWEHAKLLQMINKRISVSLHDEQISFQTIFDSNEIDLHNRNGARQNVFQYIIERTMHRPRDLIQFCKYIQKEAKETNALYFRTIKNAEKEYCYWLVNSELANEINPILKNTEAVYDLLKLLGSRPFSLSDFNDRYKAVRGITLPSEDLAYYLYDVGIILNIDPSSNPVYMRSSFRNKGRLDRNMKIMVHPGVWVGINA